MRRRMRATLRVILAFGGTLAAITAPRWARQPWLGFALAVIGWTAYAYFILGQAILSWVMVRRPVAKRPWILGGPPHLSPPQDSDRHNS
jgi:hypothetical protein